MNDGTEDDALGEESKSKAADILTTRTSKQQEREQRQIQRRV